MTKYHVRFELDEEGWWVASVARDEVYGCHTQARTLGQARRRIRWALDAAEAKDAHTAELIEEVVLPREMQKQVDVVNKMRSEEESLRSKLSTETRRVIESLAKANIRLRDAAPLLGMSHQRVHQLTAGKGGGKKGRAA